MSLFQINLCRNVHLFLAIWVYAGVLLRCRVRQKVTVNFVQTGSWENPSKMGNLRFLAHSGTAQGHENMQEGHELRQEGHENRQKKTTANSAERKGCGPFRLLAPLLLYRRRTFRTFIPTPDQEMETFEDEDE